jgi:ATP-dependent RNA helicase RhlB
VTELAYEHMNDPQIARVETDSVTADRVRQIGYMVANDEKIPLLIGLLRAHEAARTIIFVNTKRAADEVWGYLEGNGISCAILSGDVPQKKRLSLLKKFQDGEVQVLVATDVAARGLHIENVSHVINYDLPTDAEDYVHRIGRTARAGTDGDAISLVCETYAMSLPDIEDYIKARVPVEMPPLDLLVEVDPKSRVRRERLKPRHSGQGHKGSSGNRETSGKPGRRRRRRKPAASNANRSD